MITNIMDRNLSDEVVGSLVWILITLVSRESSSYMRELESGHGKKDISWDVNMVGTTPAESKEEWDSGEFEEMSSTKIDPRWSME